jgi:ubiquinone/menaquinone biosynthesis C-methylase UbiE
MSEQDKKYHPPQDESLFYYGSLYRKLLDPLIKPARTAIVDRIPANSSVLDIGCGTGLLCFELRREKHCSVTGIDLSLKMLDFANDNNPFQDIEFFHQNATDMQSFQDRRFDYVVVLNVIHEMEPADRLKLLAEALRVGTHVILFDSNVPLPWNVVGIVKRLIEITFGLDHYPQFKSYLSSGGIMGILDAYGHAFRIVEYATFAQNCNRLVHITR